MMQNAVHQAVTYLKDNPVNQIHKDFLNDPLYAHNIGHMADQNPVLALVLHDNMTLDQMRSLMLVAFETGRIIGEQMVVDSYVKGTLEDDFTPNPNG